MMKIQKIKKLNNSKNYLIILILQVFTFRRKRFEQENKQLKKYL